MRNPVTKTAGFRLTLLTAGIFSLCVLVLGSIVFFDVRGTLEQQLRQRVLAEHAQLMGDYREDGLDELRHDISERIESNPSGRLLYFLASPDGRTIFDRIEIPAPQEGWHHHQNADQSLLVHITALDDGYWLGIAADRRDIHDSESAIIHAGGVAVLFMLVIAIAAGMLISRLFIRRIDSIARTAKEIGDGHFNQRIPLRGTQDEFDQLADIINRMLGRIERLVQNLQQVSANIAHDLRTPLGHARQQLETLREDASPAHMPPITAALAHIDSALNTFSALLRIAEIESGTRRAGFQHIDLSALLEHLADAFAPVAEDAQQRLTAEIAEGVYTHADKDLLTQLCVNLIENAIRHAGAGATIQIELTPTQHGHTRISISDTGKGVAPALLEQLTTPFYRTEESRSSRGNGLGLSLVKAIAELHNMELCLSDNQPGLRIDINIPSTAAG